LKHARKSAEKLKCYSRYSLKIRSSGSDFLRFLHCKKLNSSFWDTQRPMEHQCLCLGELIAHSCISNCLYMYKQLLLHVKATNTTCRVLYYRQRGDVRLRHGSFPEPCFIHTQFDSKAGALFVKITSKKFGGVKYSPYLCTRMRVADRRDYIKLRSHLNNKAAGQVPTALIHI